MSSKGCFLKIFFYEGNEGLCPREYSPKSYEKTDLKNSQNLHASFLRCNSNSTKNHWVREKK